MEPASKSAGNAKTTAPTVQTSDLKCLERMVHLPAMQPPRTPGRSGMDHTEPQSHCTLQCSRQPAYEDDHNRARTAANGRGE
jgi:hypothetical protein